MNDEIKEILNDLEFASGVFDYTITPDRCTFLKDYITNLQQELTIMVKDDERSQETIIRLTKENERLKEILVWKQEHEKELHTRIEKAIEYINKHPVNACHELLNILQNGSEEK